MHEVNSDQQQTRRLSLGLALVAVLMFGFGFALVPLYDTLCRILGINGKVEQVTLEQINAAADAQHVLARDVRIELVTTVSEQLDWSFYPLVKTLAVTTGDSNKVLFYAKNNTDHAVTVQAIPSITPTPGAKYLRKIQCFCFERQTLQAGESVKMPVVFYVDPALPEQYRTLTLAYALFVVPDSPG